MRTLFAAAALVLLLLVPSAGPAQEEAPKNIPDTPTDVTEETRKTPVSVAHLGSDNIGSRLTFHLKELLAKSELFSLSIEDEKKVRLEVRSMQEFEERPNTTSVVALAWLYSENEGTLKYYLDGEVMLIHSATVREQAEEIMAHTQTLSAKYGYLFE
jgi:hypothetical protein